MPLKVDLSQKYIAQAQYVVAFVRDREIRLKQELVEKSFRHLFGGNQSVQTNVPDEISGSTPRFVLSDKHKTLLVSQVALSLTLQFASTKNEINEQLGVLRKNIASMESALPSFLEESRLRESGLVIVVNYPNEDPVSDMGEHLYNRFIAFPPLGKVFTTQFALGFRLDEEHYVTLSGAAYEARQGEVFAAATNAGRVVLDATETPVVGHGIEVRIDVNDKPRFDSTEILGRRDISFILDKSTDMIVNDLDKMMGFV